MLEKFYVHELPSSLLCTYGGLVACVCVCAWYPETREVPREILVCFAAPRKNRIKTRTASLVRTQGRSQLFPHQNPCNSTFLSRDARFQNFISSGLLDTTKSNCVVEKLEFSSAPEYVLNLFLSKIIFPILFYQNYSRI